MLDLNGLSLEGTLSPELGKLSHLKSLLIAIQRRNQSFEILTNLARVVPAQEKFIKIWQERRYVPIKLAPSGFVLLKDLCPTKPKVLSLCNTPSSTTLATGGSAAGQQSSVSAMAVDEEPQPPQPFEYISRVWP